MTPMQCAICGPAPYDVVYEAQIPPQDDLDFSARRTPTRAHCRIVRCGQCGLVFSNPYFPPEVIKRLYREARYITEPQLQNMARDYYAELAAALPDLRRDARILEVGCGNGFFLKALYDLGFRNLVGIEPGASAAEDAPPEVRPFIRNEFFDPSRFEPGSFDLICCFQVFDHVLDPDSVVAAFAGLLRPGGHVFAINHNIRALSARLLGERSPMYDVEHVFLFDRQTITRLFAKHGFSAIRSRSITNAYVLGYFLKMLPLPAFVRPALNRLIAAIGLDRLRIRLWGGNMATLAQRG